MRKTHSPYAPEYRRQMVELVRSGRTPGELAAGVRVFCFGDSHDPARGTALRGGGLARRRLRRPTEPLAHRAIGREHDDGGNEMSLDGEATDAPITVKDAARFLGVSPSLVYAYVERKQIPHYRMMGRSIRFRLSELVEWRQQFHENGGIDEQQDR